MSFTSKNTTAKSFNDQYSELTETDKYAFSRLCNKLLNENFIYGQLQADKTDYYAILKFRDLIENYIITEQSDTASEQKIAKYLDYRNYMKYQIIVS